MMPNSVFKLNLGSGFQPIAWYINIDNRAECNPDMLFDLTEKWPYPDSSVDEVRAHDVLEHFTPDQVIFVMNEIWRVLRPEGILDFMVPTTERGNGAFMDPYHRSYWNQASFLYYTEPTWNDLYKKTIPLFKWEEEIVHVKGIGINIVHIMGKISPVKE